MLLTIIENHSDDEAGHEAKRFAFSEVQRMGRIIDQHEDTIEALQSDIAALKVSLEETFQNIETI